MNQTTEQEFAEKMAKRLKELRGVKSQKQLAEDLGITGASYSYYEAGKRVPRDSVKLKIAKYYERSVDEIFFS